MRRGSAWEAQLEALHDRYRRNRTATLLRSHPPVKVLSDQGPRFVGCWSGEGPPDFLGILCDGRAVAFDAKDTAQRRFRLSLIARHQARDLESFQLLGGVSGIALRAEGDAYWLPWAILGPRYWDAPSSSLIREDWWRPFDVFGAGWLPEV